jgi:hypothetical protein
MQVQVKSPTSLSQRARAAQGKAQPRALIAAVALAEQSCGADGAP